METKVIEGTEEIPRIVLDKKNNRFEFSGKSLLEDARTFYHPILDWVDRYSKEPNKKTEVIYKFNYFNTSSSKILLDILRKFNDIHEKGHDIQIHWYYTEDDEDMLEAGEIYAEKVKVPFKFINY
ncbi:MAG: DUF1987 domain-containing protein [Bacteroidales bacterium]|nr:DUF1987 domain-containing protein [Bacteroidales bacterium]